MLPNVVRSLGRVCAAPRSRAPRCLHLLCRAQSPVIAVRPFTSPATADQEESRATHNPTAHQHGPDSRLSADSEAVNTLSACPGCGALAQTVVPGEAGYYNLTRGSVKRYLDHVAKARSTPDSGAQNAVFARAVSAAGDLDMAQELQQLKKSTDATSKNAISPLCDRCHDLLHHHTGVPIHHPSLESIQDTIAESPHNVNHVYHVLDAADFPMSLVPSIQRVLSAAPLRSKNRRAKTSTYRHGKTMDMSFIITRSDLLAPRKEQVDRLMPYLVEVLRDALGRTARDVRLGNVHCVSAKRGWWTRGLKADIWRRGGAGWMVGKVNVGKSNLFEVVFPKGGADDINFDRERSKAKLPVHHHASTAETAALKDEQPLVEDDEYALLPPARLETPYPTMPTVSSLPGTTASPIRIPFGKGRGELIDLPGLARSGLEAFVPPERRDDLVMKSRIAPEQYSLKSGQSLMLGGLVRISPRTELNILAYPFTPLKAAIRSDRKLAESEVSGDVPTANPDSIAAKGVPERLQSAGIYQLKWDVTKQRAGPLTRRDAVGKKATELPFKVLSTDILIESVGWVELVVQVRRKDFPDQATSGEACPQPAYPEVEIFSPNGQFVGVRRPMGAWTLGKPLREKPKRRRTVFSKLKNKK